MAIAGFAAPGFGCGLDTGTLFGSMPGKRVCSFWYCSLMSFSLSSRSPEPSTFSASGVDGIGLSFSLIVRMGGVR